MIYFSFFFFFFFVVVVVVVVVVVGVQTRKRKQYVFTYFLCFILYIKFQVPSSSDFLVLIQTKGVMNR